MFDHCTCTNLAPIVPPPSPRAMRSATSTSKPRTRAGFAGSASTNGAPPSASPPHTSTRGAPGRFCAARLVNRQRASLQVWQLALIITIQFDEGFSGGHADFAPAPLRQRRLLLLDDGRDVHVCVR